LRDIARIAGGVHPSTVSLALRNHPGVSPATRKRLQALARRLGYQPDPLLAAFNNHRIAVAPHKSEPVLAWITDLPTRNACEADPLHRGLWSAAQAAADRLHCRLDAFHLGGGEISAGRLARILEARGISVVIVAAWRHPADTLTLPWARFASVCLESPDYGAISLAVESDRLGAARTACERLHALGYRRIGLLSQGHQGARTHDLHLSGFLTAHAVRGTPPPRTLALPAPDARAVSRWVERERIDVVLVDDPDSPPRPGQPPPTGEAGSVHWATLGLVPPLPDLAGMVPDLPAIASKGIEQAVSKLRTHDFGLAPAMTRTLVPASWHAGASAPGPGWRAKR
jgi:LacI family transcriptional regulator